MSEFGFMKEVPVADVAPDFGDDREGLSPMLRELETVIGLEATLLLVDQWGGVNLYIPQSVADGHAIVEKIGLDAAEKLAGYFGGDHIAMPKAEEYRRLQRDREIYQKKKAGTPAHVLAREYNLTQRHVWQILSTEGARIQRNKYQAMMKKRSSK
jgi:Mor family transcriptional regulator